MKIICWVDPETGILAITTPAYGDITRPLSMSDDEFCEYIRTKDIPEGVTSHIIEDTDLPSDRYFRSAWEWEA